MDENNSIPERGTRTRSWNIIIYPDSAPSNWRDILDELHLEWVESPLHDRDLDPTGEPKKPHWHVTLLFSGVKAYEQVLEITKLLNGPIPQRCHNVKASVRYMAHLDNPSKFQYSPSDIIPHGGVDLADLLRPSSSERYSLIRDMIDWIKENNISEFQDLMDYASSNHFDDWFPLLCDNSAYVIGAYIKSQRHRTQTAVDTSTGEVIENKSVNSVKPKSTEDVLDDLSGTARGGWSEI